MVAPIEGRRERKSHVRRSVLSSIAGVLGDFRMHGPIRSHEIRDNPRNPLTAKDGFFWTGPIRTLKERGSDMSFRHLLQHFRMIPPSPSAMGPEAEADHVRRLINDAYQAGLAAGGGAGLRADLKGARGEMASALVATLKQLMRIADAADLNETLALTIRCHHEELCQGRANSAGTGSQRWN